MDEQRLRALEQKLDRIEKHCSNMTDHIGFVERVYNVMRTPFQLLLNAFSFRFSQLPDESTKLLSE